MIKSEPRRGLIYAGETPLASSIAVEQTGPMQLTIRAGSLTTTGQARVVPADEVANLDAMIANGSAELVAGQPGKLRIWLTNQDGSFVEKSATHVLTSDQVLDLTADPDMPKKYQVGLIVDGGGAVDVLARSRLDADYPEAPAGWRVVHTLVYDLLLPAGTTDLSGLDIFVFTTAPGFPA